MRSMVLPRRLSALTTLALSASFMVSSVATAPAAHAVTPTEYKMARYINYSRSSRGIAKMRVSAALSYTARKHSAAMANRGSIYHTSNLSYTLRSYSWRVAGENVGRGPTLYGIHKAMMDSPSHRSNILYRSFKVVGVGIVFRGGRVYVTEMFLG